MTFKHFLFAGAVFLAGSVSGYFLYPQLSPAAMQPAASALVPSTTPTQATSVPKPVPTSTAEANQPAQAARASEIDVLIRILAALNLPSSTERMATILPLLPHLNFADTEHAIFVALSQEPELGMLPFFMQHLATLNAEAAARAAQGLLDQKLRYLSLREVFSTWARSHPEAALQWAEKSLLSYERDTAIKAIFRVLLESNIEQAFALQDRFSSLVGPYLLDKMYARLAQVNLGRAIDELKKIPSSTQRDSIVRAVVAEWAKIDPKGAYRWALQLSPERTRLMALQSIVSEWVQKNPTEIAQRVLELPPGLIRTSLINTLTQQWAQENPAQVLDFSIKLMTQEQDSVYSVTLSTWAETDPKAALSYANQHMPRGEKFNQLIVSIFRRLTDRYSLEEIKQFLTLIPSELRNKTTAALIPHLVSRDFDKAQQLLKQLDFSQVGSYAHEALIAVAQEYTRQDPEKALHWTKQLPMQYVRQTQSYIYDLWADENPVKAVEYALQHHSERVAGITYSWAIYSPEEALDWVVRLRNDGLKREVLSSIVQQIAREYPEIVIVRIDSFPTEIANQAVPLVIERWAYRDPKSALAWLKQQSRLNDEAQTQAYGSLFNSWMEGNQTEALAWFEQLPKDALRDRLLLSYSSNQSWDRPDVALQWATGISNAEEREQQIQNLVSIWLLEDPNHAQDWIKNNTLLSAGQKQKLLQMAKEMEAE